MKQHRERPAPSPPEAGLIPWIAVITMESPRIVTRYEAPEGLITDLCGKGGDLPFRFDALKHRLLTGPVAPVSHPPFRILNVYAVDAGDRFNEGTRYEFWASWPDYKMVGGTLFYYPTRYLLVRLDSSPLTVKPARLLVESSPGGKWASARVMFRDACEGYVARERRRGTPPDAVYPCGLFEGPIGVLRYHPDKLAFKRDPRDGVYYHV